MILTFFSKNEMFKMSRTVLAVLGVFGVVLLLAALDGRITGNAFAYNLTYSCQDSDKGNDPYQRGTIEYKDTTFAGPKRTATDTCVNSAYLLEHYCEGTVHLEENIPCRCQDGACKR